MKFNAIIIVIVLVLLAGVGIFTFINSQKENGKAGLPEEKGSGEEVESLTKILGLAKNIPSVKYDMITTYPGHPTMTQEMWLKEKKMRMETTIEGQTMVYLVDYVKETSYTYSAAQDIAMKMDFNRVKETFGDSVVGQSESIAEYNPVVIGKEVMDGKDCLILEYTTGEGVMKSWIWKKYGLVIRMEMTMAQGKSVIELKNIDFGDISDEIFELPDNIQIMEMPNL